MKQYWSIITSFLLENKTSKQTVIKNTFRLILAEGISKGSIALITILIGRLFGTEVFGIYSYRGVILAFLVIFADLGLTTLLIRDYQHLDTHHRSHYLSQGLKTKGLLSLGVIIIFGCILFFATDDLMIRQVGSMLLLYGLTNSFLEYLRGTFRSLQRSQVEFQIKLIQGIGNLCIIPLLFYVSSIVPVIGAQALVGMITIGYAYHIIRKKQDMKADDSTQAYWIQKIELIRNGWMFAMSGFFMSVYYYIDTFIIKIYHPYVEVGLYNAAYKFITMLLIPLNLFGSSLFPVLRKKYISKTLLKSEIYNYTYKVGLLYSVVVILSLLFSENLFYYTFGENYIASVLVFRILGCSLLFGGFKFIIARFYLSTNKEKYHLFGTILASIINVSLNLIYVPMYGIIGAAITTLITEIFLLIYFVNIFYSLKFKNEEN